MASSAIEILGLLFVLKIFAAWGLLTLLVLTAAHAWLALSRRGSRERTGRDRHANNIWSFPDPPSGQAQ